MRAALFVGLTVAASVAASASFEAIEHALDSVDSVLEESSLTRAPVPPLKPRQRPHHHLAGELEAKAGRVGRTEGKPLAPRFFTPQPHPIDMMAASHERRPLPALLLIPLIVKGALAVAHSLATKKGLAHVLSKFGSKVVAKKGLKHMATKCLAGLGTYIAEKATHAGLTCGSDAVKTKALMMKKVEEEEADVSIPSELQFDSDKNLGTSDRADLQEAMDDGGTNSPTAMLDSVFYNIKEQGGIKSEDGEIMLGGTPCEDGSNEEGCDAASLPELVQTGDAAGTIALTDDEKKAMDEDEAKYKSVLKGEMAEAVLTALLNAKKMCKLVYKTAFVLAGVKRLEETTLACKCGGAESNICKKALSVGVVPQSLA